MSDETASNHPKEFDEVFADTALGWGGIVVGPDGVGHPIDEADALARAMAAWVDAPEHLDSAVALCLTAIDRPEPHVRYAALTFFAEVWRRYGNIGRRNEVTRAIRRRLQDPDPEVRASAKSTATVFDIKND
jgi:hypothetical protein